MAAAAEIVVASALAVITWSGVLVDYYDLIGRAEFRRLCRRRRTCRTMSTQERPTRTLAYPTIGRVMSCDGSGWIERDHVSVSGAGHTSRRQCDNQPDRSCHVTTGDHGFHAVGMTIVRRRTQHRA